MRYRVDYGPLTDDEAARFLPGLLQRLEFRPSLHWRRRDALRAARLDGHPATTVTDRWTGRRIDTDWAAS